MITIKILKAIFFMCMVDVDPRFDKDVCSNHMVKCVQRGVDYDDCSDYWEPYITDKYDYYGDPSEADLSY